MMTQRRRKKSEKRKTTEQVERVRKKKKTSSSKKQIDNRRRQRSVKPVKKTGKRKSVQQSQKGKKKPRKKSVRRKKQSVKVFLLEVGITLLLFTAVVFILSKVTFTTIKVEGYSMTEQLNDGDRLFVNRMKKPKQLDLVVFKDSKGEILVRRVIGTPGDRLYYKDDQLYINEEQKLERYLENAVSVAKQGGMKTTEDFTLMQLTGKNSVPENKYFVLGDNRQYATDSRYFGFIDQKNIVGVVEFRFFPFHTLAGF
ncbi:signal peptidase I [Enterococcus sp. BWR-S5]|uniref:signal peptidase I n=1 Tax=Enterococcus sp. BWR-S5 TaxID=2787714 RepID=UPI001F01D1A0|nr:signal peptidase I [Enterococcus sp. BWR-S5]